MNTKTETQTTHTPGPWHVNGIEAIFSVIGNRSVAKVYNPESDARLIASAPDLLAACEQVLSYLGVAGGRSASTQVYERILREAIAKATA